MSNERRWMMDEVTVIRPEYEAELRGMVRALAEATGLHSRWVASSALQATADNAIDELLSTVDALRAERDAAVARAEAAEAALAGAEQRAELAEAEAEHTTERAITVAWLRSRAEVGGDPWMVHVADEIESGLHVVMHDF